MISALQASSMDRGETLGPSSSLKDASASGPREFAIAKFIFFRAKTRASDQRQGAVDIPMIEGRVGLGYQCMCIRHESSGINMRTLDVMHGIALETRLKQEAGLPHQ
jgi:hypothetical protein